MPLDEKNGSHVRDRPPALSALQINASVASFQGQHREAGQACPLTRAAKSVFVTGTTS
jgi:hypothetical protein